MPLRAPAVASAFACRLACAYLRRRTRSRRWLALCEPPSAEAFAIRLGLLRLPLKGGVILECLKGRLGGDWGRDDLRVGDHEPLARAAAEGEVIPRLERLPNRYLHRSWEAPARVLEEAGVHLGQDYPYPVVDHSRARDRFLRMARNYLRGRGGNADG